MNTTNISFINRKKFSAEELSNILLLIQNKLADGYVAGIVRDKNQQVVAVFDTDGVVNSVKWQK